MLQDNQILKVRAGHEDPLHNLYSKIQFDLIEISHLGTFNARMDIWAVAFTKSPDPEHLLFTILLDLQFRMNRAIWEHFNGETKR